MRALVNFSLGDWKVYRFAFSHSFFCGRDFCTFLGIVSDVIKSIFVRLIFLIFFPTRLGFRLHYINNKFKISRHSNEFQKKKIKGRRTFVKISEFQQIYLQIIIILSFIYWSWIKNQNKCRTLVSSVNQKHLTTIPFHFLNFILALHEYM